MSGREDGERENDLHPGAEVRALAGAPVFGQKNVEHRKNTRFPSRKPGQTIDKAHVLQVKTWAFRMQ